MHQHQFGVDAFIVLWRDIPRYRPLAWFANLPIIYTLAGLLYDYILAPMLYWINTKKG